MSEAGGPHCSEPATRAADSGCTAAGPIGWLNGELAAYGRHPGPGQLPAPNPRQPFPAPAAPAGTRTSATRAAVSAGAAGNTSASRGDQDRMPERDGTAALARRVTWLG